MRLSRKESRIVNRTIEAWVDEQVIDHQQADKLKHACEVTRFDWRRLAKYSFWLAVTCIVIAVSAVLADELLMALIEKFFNAPDIVKCLGLAALSALLYYLGLKRRDRFPQKFYSNEALMFLGVLATAASIGYLGKMLETGSGHFSLLLLLASLVYGAVGLSVHSKLIWVFALLSLGSWFGAETGYISGWGAYYLGMNYPMRFVLFGLVLLLAGSWVFRHWVSRREFLAPTRAIGLLYLFIALWILSIFGNYGDPDAWEGARQIELFHWALLFGVAAVISIFHGVKYDDGMTRGFGLTFIFINLYTRLFEYFWDHTHKAIFFALLAASFWYLGTHAERIWNLDMLSKRREAGDR